MWAADIKECLDFEIDYLHGETFALIGYLTALEVIEVDLVSRTDILFTGLLTKLGLGFFVFALMRATDESFDCMGTFDGVDFTGVACRKIDCSVYFRIILLKS